MVKQIAITASACALSLIVGWAIGSGHSHEMGDTIPDLYNEHVSGKYRYTNELLACGDINSLSVGSMETLRETTRSLIDQAKEESSIVTAAVYVRDLDNGPWMGLNEKALFYPASMLKLPLIIAMYKEAENDPKLLDKKITFVTPVIERTDLLFPPSHPIEVGKSYTMRELARRALVYSDNEAAALAGNEVGFDNIAQAFSDLGIREPKPGEDYQLSVRTYGSFLRVLYNASYVQRDYSEEILKMLSESEFQNGISVGVASGVAVAHKFGEREGEVVDNNVQLHDCGIVYSPGRPYLLCVMAQAKKPAHILDLMHKVSLATYQIMSQP